MDPLSERHVGQDCSLPNPARCGGLGRYCRLMNANEALIERVDRIGTRINGHPERVDAVLDELIGLLESERDAEVLAATVWALGMAWNERASLASAALAGHPDPRVRLAVARTVSCDIDSADAVAIVVEVLIGLSVDVDENVRDWAVFGLGTMLEVDSDRVREALWARIDDVGTDVADEALVGLARRRDVRCSPVVADRLGRWEVGALVFEAAELLGDPRLLDALRPWMSRLPDDDSVRRAWLACAGRSA